METLSIFLIALALSMDSVAVALASGISLKKKNIFIFLRVAFFLGACHPIMLYFGWNAGQNFQNFIVSFHHWIGFLALCFLGVRMIYQSNVKKNTHCFSVTNYVVLLGLSLATSIDALIVGFDFGVRNIHPYPVMAIIGITSFSLTLAAVTIGSKFKTLSQIRVETIGGIILIGVGCKILIEHFLGY